MSYGGKPTEAERKLVTTSTPGGLEAAKMAARELAEAAVYGTSMPEAVICDEEMLMRQRQWHFAQLDFSRFAPRLMPGFRDSVAPRALHAHALAGYFREWIKGKA